MVASRPISCPISSRSGQRLLPGTPWTRGAAGKRGLAKLKNNNDIAGDLPPTTSAESLTLASTAIRQVCLLIDMDGKGWKLTIEKLQMVLVWPT